MLITSSTGFSACSSQRKMGPLSLSRPSTAGSWFSSRPPLHPRLASPPSATGSADHPQPYAPRSVVVLPGLGNNAMDYSDLATLLNQRHGLHVSVAPVSRLDWARNAKGLLDANYWRGTLNPRPTVDWYLERIAVAVEEAKAAQPDAPITLLAHSAGGWLGRLYMLDFNRTVIDRFVSLGSPHLPPPPGVVDQTRGILTWMGANAPGAFHDDVEYVTIAGRWVKGAPLQGPGALQKRVIGAGYQQVCGAADVWGDGVVPETTAHLEGALQLTLDGVYHSPLGAEDGAAVPSFDESPLDSDDYTVSVVEVERAAQGAKPGPRLWYGSETVLEQWAPLLWGSESGGMGR